MTVDLGSLQPRTRVEAPPFLGQGAAVLELLGGFGGELVEVVGPVASAPLYPMLLARRQGLAFAGVTVHLVDGGSVAHVLGDHQMFLPGPEAAEIDYAEGLCRQLADRVDGELERPAVLPALAGGGPVDLSEIGVCIVHHDRPGVLERAVASYETQSCDGFELVVVDNGSSTRFADDLARIEGRLADRGWSMLRVPDGPVGEARNAGAERLSTPWVVFADDDNIARPEQLSVFSAVAGRTGADVLTCGFTTFTDTDPAGMPGELSDVLFTGGCVLGGVARNCFGDNNAMWCSAALSKIGGYGPVHENDDFELFARACLAGLHLETIPFSLFWYHQHPARALSAGHLWRGYSNTLAAYRAVMPAGLEALPEMAFGSWAQMSGFAHRVQIEPPAQTR